jgi:serine/threonine protein kinase
LGDRYRSQKIIGQGGFGRTFLAVDEYKPSKLPCVIKQFYPQAQGTSSIQKATELFEQEAVRLEQLGKYSQIPDLLAYFSQDGRQYLVQEFIDGENLAQALESQGYFRETQIRDLLKNLLPTFEFIHSRQVIHRDIKPENIILRPDGQLVLVDFGAAKYATQTALSVTGTVIGTAGYTAPEQAAGKAIYASDIYSLGVTCLYLLTQVEPIDLFDTSEMEWVWREHLKASVSSELGLILDKMILPASKRRYQSATEVLQALGTQSPQASPQTPPLSTDSLKSALGVDYTRLRDLLAAGKWKEADQETLKVMLKAARREKEGWLNNNDIDKFPCDDLRTIDQLWVKYSQGRVGFSVQKEIWLSLGGKVDWDTEKKLGDRVGWRKGRKSWFNYDDLTFNLQAPPGHLPWVRCCVRVDFGFVSGCGWWGLVFFSRIESCNLSPQTSHQPSPQPSPDSLKSARGVDYTCLRNLLAAGKWKEADQETLKVMLKAARREKEGYFNKESIDNFPCDDLRTIDQLWVKYSQGRFGFSIQKKIWLEVGGKVDWETECKLGDRVGWRKGGSWLDTKELTYNKQAPVGHLPRELCGWWGGFRGLGVKWRYGSSLASRTVSCNLYCN